MPNNPPTKQDAGDGGKFIPERSMNDNQQYRRYMYQAHQRKYYSRNTKIAKWRRGKYSGRQPKAGAGWMQYEEYTTSGGADAGKN